jgi:DNA-binding winged helix-turn-helix (wHTH) protein
MAPGSFHFEGFHLDPGGRQLRRDDARVELNTRYLDALTLLVSEQGKLVSKDRFFQEVWRGVPVTDEALTQCISTLRKQLGDDAASPRFIETVPKHGYRFIAPVTPAAPDHPTQPASEVRPAELDPPQPLRQPLLLGASGMIGGGAAGVLGGLFYGLGGASPSLQPGVGAASALFVLLCLNVVVGLLGGAGVAFGIAAAGLAPGRPWLLSIAGGAAGGLVVGAFGKLLGLDAFSLLFGQSPGDLTGAGEGALLGAAVGLGAWLGGRGGSIAPLGRGVAVAALSGGVAGLLIPLLGGRLMGGSLDLLARAFPGSRLRLDQIGALFGESGFGPISRMATGALEGALFSGCVVGAMLLARRSPGGSGRRTPSG